MTSKGSMAKIKNDITDDINPDGERYRRVQNSKMMKDIRCTMIQVVMASESKLTETMKDIRDYNDQNDEEFMEYNDQDDGDQKLKSLTWSNTTKSIMIKMITKPKSR